MSGKAKRYRAIFAVVAAAALAAAAQARADGADQWVGALAGGLIGGIVGSEIGKGAGREIAIGAGALIGGLSGRYLAGAAPEPYWRESRAHRHRADSWRHWRPRHRHHHHHYRQPWPETVVIRETVHVAPPPPRRYVRRVARAAAPERAAPFTECRTLEEGPAAVYACRTTHGEWRVLR